MNLIQQFVRKPQQLWLRKALFQIHLWLGIFLVLYLIVVGLTGSILVFKEEAVASLVPKAREPLLSDPVGASLASVIGKLKSRYPGFRIPVLYFPSQGVAEYQAIAMGQVEGIPSKFMISSDPATGNVIGDVNLTSSWLGFVHNLHITLLAGTPGFIANGVGAALLLIATLSGLVLWWPGIRSWKRGFLVDFSKSWKRINWDLHNTIGFYTLGIVSFWAISTIYFVIPEQFTAFLNGFSTVTIEPPGSAKVQIRAHADGEPLPADRLIERARGLSPDARPIAVALPPGPNAPFVVFMMHGHHAIDTAEMPESAERIYFDPYSGDHLATELPPENRTIGDWIVWSMIPLHFGNKWGMTVKIVWAVVGLSIPILAITGLLMYWNRYLSKKWRKLGQRPLPRHEETMHMAAIAVLVAIAGASMCSAQPTPRNCDAAPNVERRVVQSSDSRREFLIYISKPSEPPPPGGYPVVYALDGNAVIDALARNPSSSAGLLIVGVGYKTALCIDADARTLDYTPAGKNGEPFADPARPSRTAGGANEFLAFLRDELRPLIERDFPVDRSRQTLYGHSYGGLFVLHALFMQPDLFETYIAASPSIWWNSEFILSEARRPMGKRVLLLEGSLERNSGQTRNRGNSPNAVENLAARIGAEYVLIPGKAHGEMLAASLDSTTAFAMKKQAPQINK